MRETWTDERLGDLSHRVDGGFEEVGREFKAQRLEMKTEFAAVRSEMQAEFAAVRSEMQAEFAAVRSEMKAEFAAVRSEMRTEFAAVRAEMAALNRTLIQVSVGALATLAVGFGGTIATILTQA